MRIRWALLAAGLALLWFVPGHARAEWQSAGCAAGDYLVGVGGNGGVWIDRIQAICAHWDAAAKTTGPQLPTATLATSTGGSPRKAVCPPNSAVIGLSFYLPDIDGQRHAEDLVLICGTLGQPHVRLADRPSFPTTGSHGPGTPFADGELAGDAAACPAGQVATGFSANVAQFVGDIQLKNHCVPWPAPVASIPTPNTSVPVPATNAPSVPAMPAAPAGAMAGVDLPGSDFFSFASGGPPNCALSCSKNSGCKAWTWLQASPGAAAAGTCFLKNAVPSAVGNPKTISGIVASAAPATSAGTGSGAGTGAGTGGATPSTGAGGASGSGSGSPATGGGATGSPGGGAGYPPAPKGALLGYDRLGSDLGAAFSPTPKTCAHTCSHTSGCQSWTWTLPGTNGNPLPMCFMKFTIPAAAPNPCCVSSGP